MLKISRRRFPLSMALGCLVLATAFAAPPAVAADEWPSRPITIMVPFAAGGNVDVAARLFAKELSAKLGQNVIIENKPGAGGGIASATVAKAAADGYTLLLTTNGPAVLNSMLYRSLPYNPDKDFAPIIITNDVPQVLVVDPKLPIRTVKDLVAYASGRPEGITIGHAGPGTMGHLAALLLVSQTKMNAVLVSYRGAAPIVTDLLGGQINAGFPAYIPQLSSVRAIGVTSDARLLALPDVPTFAEAAGDAKVLATTWNALMGPAGLPRETIMKINTVLNHYLQTDEAKTALAALGARPLGGTPESVVVEMTKEKAKWEPIIKAANLVLD